MAKKAAAMTTTEEKTQAIVLGAQDVVSAISMRAGKGVADKEAYLVAADDTKMLKRVLDNIDAQRRELVDPLNEVVKKINSRVKPMVDTIKMFIDLRKQDILNYEEAERKKAIQEAEKRAKKVERSAPELAADIRNNALAAPVVEAVAGISRRRRWTYRILDPQVVPRDFLQLDTSKLQKFAEAMKGSASVTGVEFFEETILGASGK